MDLLIFILICYGATNIIVNGSIFWKVREWIESKNEFLGDLVNCVMCTGFWIGVIFSFSVDINFFFAGCLSSGACWIIQTFIDK